MKIIIKISNKFLKYYIVHALMLTQETNGNDVGRTQPNPIRQQQPKLKKQQTKIYEMKLNLRLIIPIMLLLSLSLSPWSTRLNFPLTGASFKA